MAYKCEFCGKGVAYGHAVSHAKNRVRRLFKPNLQKIRALRDGVNIRVKFCTSCIKRLKRDGILGLFKIPSYKPAASLKLATAKDTKVKIVETVSVVPTLDISSIVGKKS